MAYTAMAGDTSGYLELVRSDPRELDILAKDLLINVTGFFRDPEVFRHLESRIIPDLLARQAPDGALRVWIAGCSSGEETYSLAMLFSEAVAASGARTKLQFFASDIDPEAVALAREGRYPATIEGAVSPARLARFFSKVDQGYRVSSDLRALVVFTVQDVLSDPPFSRVDMISCRNLLIYLLPEAQARVISIFHFALREGGVLLLGSAEAVADPGDRFEVLSKPDRLYRQLGGQKGTHHGAASRIADGARRVPSGRVRGLSDQAVLAELVRRTILELHGPAAVLVNAKNECLYSLGPTDRFLRIPAGHPNNDMLALARPALRSKLRSAMQRARESRALVSVDGGRGEPGSDQGPFRIEVHPLSHAGEPLLLVCFVADPGTKISGSGATSKGAPDSGYERELEVIKADLQVALRELELSGQEQNAIAEEALSVDEEHQAANEELVTSKEELQALNEELTALNGQLQETLERQRTTSDDLQNVLYSTDVATLFLDAELRIRFFTPATRSLFNVIPGDVGRPLSDLSSLALDGALAGDARSVLRDSKPIEREIETPGGTWFNRRISPYKAHSGKVEGVVITFTDVTGRNQAARALEAATRRSEQANGAKSRFLAAASHDLRQPLQTLGLLQGLMAKWADGEQMQGLVARVGETLGAMSGMLDTLLDINQLEAGVVRAERARFTAGEMLERLRVEFTADAEAKGLSLIVMPCSVVVETDRRLLKQMIRNLLSNALKYTNSGRVLLGCRRRHSSLVFELWDTGVGIPPEELASIFEEYHQLGNPARERGRGLGLGLAIVQRLGNLLDHRVSVVSRPGKGSVFSIEVALPSRQASGSAAPAAVAGAATVEALATRDAAVLPAAEGAAILVVEDDKDVRELLELALKAEGHRPVGAFDGNDAYDLVSRGAVVPDLLLADYNLPNGPNGLQLASSIREALGVEIPVIILTGDISTATLQDVRRNGCTQLNKPVRLPELARTIAGLLPALPVAPPRLTGEPGPPHRSRVFVVDDDAAFCAAMCSVLEDSGSTAEAFPTAEAFLASYRSAEDECVLIDGYLPGMSGITLLRRLREGGHQVPVIMITGHSDVPTVVQAMKAGASDFVEKPIGNVALLASVGRALEQSRDANKLTVWRLAAAAQVAALTPRQREIMALVLVGKPNKNIASDLHLSQRTVENHRASIMRRTGAKSLPELARLAVAAAQGQEDG